MAQIKLPSASNEVHWSTEKYLVTRTPTIAEGQYVVLERNKTRTSIHVLDSDLRPSDLFFGGWWGREGWLEGGGKLINMRVCAPRMMWLWCHVNGRLVQTCTTQGANSQMGRGITPHHSMLMCVLIFFPYVLQDRVIMQMFIFSRSHKLLEIQ